MKVEIIGNLLCYSCGTDSALCEVRIGRSKRIACDRCCENLSLCNCGDETLKGRSVCYQCYMKDLKEKYKGRLCACGTKVLTGRAICHKCKYKNSQVGKSIEKFEHDEGLRKIAEGVK